MLRPSRPMMRPFISSLGSGTTETDDSETWSDAQRWIDVVMIRRARSSASSFACASIWRTSLFACSRISDSTLRKKDLLGLFTREPGDPLELTALLGDQFVDLRAMCVELLLALGEPALALLQLLDAPIEVLFLLLQASLLPLDLGAALARVLFGRGAQPVCLVLCLENNLFLLCLGFCHEAFGVCPGGGSGLCGLLAANVVGNRSHDDRNHHRDGDYNSHVV